MMESGVSRVQTGGARSIVALFLFVVIASSGIGVVGKVQADDDVFPGTRVGLEGIVLPVPQVGDAWAYRLPKVPQDHPDWESSQAKTRTMWMHWGEPGLSLGADGTLHRVNRLIRTHPGEADEWWSRNYDAVTGHIVSVESNRANTSSRADFSDPFDGSVTSSAHSIYPMPFGGTPCLFLNAAQGVPIQTKDGMRLEACHVWNDWNAATAHLSYAGAYTVDGLTYAVFENEDTPKPFWHVERAIFRTDLPIPVQVTLWTLEDERTYRIHVDLTHFRAGHAPLASEPVAPWRLPPVEWAAPTRWGMDDAGLDHPYPLNQAFRDKMDDPLDDSLRSFMQKHPDATAHTMGYERVEGEDAIRHRWSWHMAEGAAQEAFCVEMEQPFGASPPVYVQQVTRSGPFEWCRAWAPEPDEYEIPSAMPTVTSLQHVWSEFARLMDLPDGPITWDVRYWPEGAPRYEVGIKHLTTRQPALATATGDDTLSGTSATIEFGGDGRLGSIRMGQANYTPEAPAFLSENDDDLHPAAAAVQEVPVWAFPDSRTAFVWTLLSFLLAALYWLFPHLKHGLLTPLFSRIQRDDALDNEARATIVAAVEAEPGIHDRELQRRSGLARGQLRHHLEKLVDTGIVRRRRVEGLTTYWPAEGAASRTPEDVVALRSPLAREVHAALQEEPHLALSELARRLGKNRQTVSYHVRRLRAAGLLPS